MSNIDERRLACPCTERSRCMFRREEAVNIVLSEGAITSRKLKEKLDSLNKSSYEVRKAFSFLHHKGRKGEKEGCPYVSILKKASGEAVYVYGRSKVYISKLLNSKTLRDRLRNIATRRQKTILSSLETRLFNTYYLSSYEIRKLLPWRRDYIREALEQLQDLGLIREIQVNLRRTKSKKEVKAEPLGELLAVIKTRTFPEDVSTFYVGVDDVDTFRKNQETLAIEEMTEMGIIVEIQRRIMTLYPPGLVMFENKESYEDTVRPKSEFQMKRANGMSFDLFLTLNHSIGGKRYVAADVYTRFPVTETVFRSFSKKIRNVGPAFGILFVKKDMVNSRARFLCLKRNSGKREFGFITIEEIGVDYAACRKIVEEEHSTVSTS